MKALRDARPARQLTLLGPDPLRHISRNPAEDAAFSREGATIFFGGVEEIYDKWPEPVAIISDGPYGVQGYPGDPPTHEALAAWYRPHVVEWAKRANSQTTLWFWNTEIGWATVHPLLIEHGFEYRSCHIWNKGIGHIAGNANSQTLRKFPVITEVCVQYVKPARFSIGGEWKSMQAWLRHEWARSGLPFGLANKACGVANAATRKYLAADHLWYYPPPEAFEAMARYTNEHGDKEGRPYFSLDGQKPLSGAEWARMRAKFRCEVGISNVWNEPQVRGRERLKARGAGRSLHLNQKPLKLIEIAIRASTDEGDMIWEPFGGLCPAAIASHKLRRRCVSAERERTFYEAAVQRLATYDAG